jgi:hypothetical protein
MAPALLVDLGLEAIRHPARPRRPSGSGSGRAFRRRRRDRRAGLPRAYRDAPRKPIRNPRKVRIPWSLSHQAQRQHELRAVDLVMLIDEVL